MAVVTDQVHRLRIGELHVVDQAALLLLQALAGVELIGHRCRRVRVLRELRGGEPQRILRIRARHDIRDERKLVAV